MSYAFADQRIVDPLAVYAGLQHPVAAAALPQAQKAVRIAVVGEDGVIHPTGSRMVWPVRCKRK